MSDAKRARVASPVSSESSREPTDSLLDVLADHVCEEASNAAEKLHAEYKDATGENLIKVRPLEVRAGCRALKLGENFLETTRDVQCICVSGDDVERVQTAFFDVVAQVLAFQATIREAHERLQESLPSAITEELDSALANWWPPHARVLAQMLVDVGDEVTPSDLDDDGEDDDDEESDEDDDEEEGEEGEEEEEDEEDDDDDDDEADASADDLCEDA